MKRTRTLPRFYACQKSGLRGLNSRDWIKCLKVNLELIHVNPSECEHLRNVVPLFVSELSLQRTNVQVYMLFCNMKFGIPYDKRSDASFWPAAQLLCTMVDKISALIYVGCPGYIPFNLACKLYENMKQPGGGDFRIWMFDTYMDKWFLKSSKDGIFEETTRPDHLQLCDYHSIGLMQDDRGDSKEMNRIFE